MNTAKMIALVLGVLMVLLGVTALAMPERVLPLAQFTTTPNGVYVATVIRLAIGIILLFAASQSRFPKVLRVISVLALVAGIATLMFGSSGVRLMASSLSKNGTVVVRVIGTFALLVGAFVVYALLTNSHRRSSNS